jgi:23S rRNA pseudouridine1911/1915/1917 synthase
VEKFDLKVPFLYVEKRADAYLTEALAGRFSREEVKRAIEEGSVLLNGKPAKPGVKVKEGDRFEGEVSSSRPAAPAGEAISLKILYEDADLLVIDKPCGMVVHPGAGNRSGTLVNALLGRGGNLSGLGGEERPGIVHRLDKDTSGIILVAKTNRAHRRLQSQFESRSLSKTYVALVSGRVDFDEGHLEGSIGRHPKLRHKMAVSTRDDAKEALTRYRVTRRLAGATLLEVDLHSGRTHQIRVHMAHLGHPVVGDKIYGPSPAAAAAAGRLGLHAAKIVFEHPETGKTLAFESPLPDDFAALIRRYETPDAKKR